MSEIWAIIPARCGSKGIINKNIKHLGGKPLISWTINACKRSNLINRIIFSSDSKEYIQIAQDYGAEAPFLRPKSISHDGSSDLEFVKHCLNWANNNDQKIPEFILHMRPTTPFRDPQLIDKAINNFLKIDDKTSMRSVHLMSESSYKNFEIDDFGYLRTIFSFDRNIEQSNKMRQSFKNTYTPNGYVDILSTKFILENNLIHGNKSISFITPYVSEVDTKEDFQYLEFQLSNNKKIFEEIFI